jgi:hypothetical protein
MQRYEIEAWLGDDHGLTEDQIRDLLRTADEIAARYPDPDDADDRETALTVAYRLLVEPPENVVDELGAALTRARVAEANAKAALRQAAVTLVRVGDRSARGVRSQAGFATAAGVDRMAVKDWLGLR